MRLVILFLFLTFNAPAQNIVSVYPTEDFDPSSTRVVDSNIVAVNPLPFDMVYIVEFDKDEYISKVVLDRNTDSIKVSAFINGEWVVFEKSNQQTFEVAQTVRYLRVQFKKGCAKTHLMVK